MIFRWLKSFFTAPKYWKTYAKINKARQPKDFKQARFVFFDTETTGLDILKDEILSIGAISLVDNELDVMSSFECYLKQNVFNSETVEIHGIIKGGDVEKIPEEKALIDFLDFIENAILVAHHASFDIVMINKGLKKLGLPNLKNKVVDTGVLFKKLKDSNKPHYSLDELCKNFNIHMHDRHTASGDAYLTSIIFLKTLSQLRKERNVHFDDLFINR